MMTTRSQQDISEPPAAKEISVVQSAPVVALKSILKPVASNRQMKATDSGLSIGRKVQWQPQVEVIYYAGDSVVGIAKEDLSEEVDQLARKAAYIRGYTRMQRSLVERVPLLEDCDSYLP